MITSTIGKIFLEAYNKKFSTNYDAKTFFVEVYYPLFFDDNKYLMTAGNTPLENPKLSWDDMIAGKKPYETKEQRKERFQKLMEKIEDNLPNTENSIGFASSDVMATTSGQTSNIQYPFSEDDIYLSWIGASFGIGIEKGLSMLFPVAEILLDLFEGWNLYRKVLNATDKLKGNKINAWNGQWIVHRYDKKCFFQDSPMAEFHPLVNKKDEDGLTVGTQSWLKVIVKIAQHFQNPQMMCYVYSFGKSNTTIGFIPLNLEHIRKPFELYKILFGIDEGDKAETLWSSEYAFKVCCQKGAIGIEAMKPSGLEKYIKDGAKKVKYNLNDEEQKISFHTYQIWLLAMLNNQELWDMSLKFAKALNAYARSGVKGKTTNSRQIDEVLKATNKRSFIEALGNIASDISDIDNIQEVALVVNNMPTDNVPYFLTLVRFHVSSLNNKKSTN